MATPKQNIPFVTAYGPKLKVPYDDDGITLVEQSHKDSCDINNIMKRYQRTGAIDHVKTHGGQYGDFTSMDLRTALDTMMTAQNMFDELPSKVRKRFDNDPAKFLDFVQDDTNREEAGALGLLTVEALREQAANAATDKNGSSPVGDIPVEGDPGGA